ncbi:MAG: hypothetical protein KAX24_12900 [Anaerolineae bacterium]|nr:hypothetical protein [Anaerolineae bacterium]
MILYDCNIDPPAPFVEVIVRHPTTDQQDILPAQLDTGADISGIPQRARYYSRSLWCVIPSERSESRNLYLRWQA